MSWPGGAGNVISKPAFSIEDYQTLVDGSRPTSAPRVNTIPPVAKAKATAAPSSGLLQRCDISGSGSSGADNSEGQDDPGETAPAQKRPAAKQVPKKTKKEDDSDILGSCKGNRRDDEEPDDEAEAAPSSKKDKKQKKKKKEDSKKVKKSKTDEKKSGKGQKGKKHEDGGGVEVQSSSSSSVEEETGVTVDMFLEAQQRAEIAESLAMVRNLSTNEVDDRVCKQYSKVCGDSIERKNDIDDHKSDTTLELGFWDKEDEEGQIEEPIAFHPPTSDNNADVYVWHNGDEVHVAPGAVLTLEELHSLRVQTRALDIIDNGRHIPYEDEPAKKDLGILDDESNDKMQETAHFAEFTCDGYGLLAEESELFGDATPQPTEREDHQGNVLEATERAEDHAGRQEQKGTSQEDSLPMLKNTAPKEDGSSLNTSSASPAAETVPQPSARKEGVPLCGPIDIEDDPASPTPVIHLDPVDPLGGSSETLATRGKGRRPSAKAKPKSKPRAEPKSRQRPHVAAPKRKAGAKAKAKAKSKAKAAANNKAKTKNSKPAKRNRAKAKACPKRKASKGLKMDANNIYSREYHRFKRMGFSAEQAKGAARRAVRISQSSDPAGEVTWI